MELKGKEVYIRVIEPEDAEMLFKWENNPENWLVSNTLKPFSKYQIEQYAFSDQDIYTNRQLRFVICLIENDTAIGAIDLFEYDPFHERAGVSVLIADADNRKKGYASEALQLLVTYTQEVLVLKQVFCNILTSNTASLSLFEKQGFEIAGEKKEWVKHNQAWVGEYLLQKILK